MRNIEKQLINSSKSLPKMEKEILIPDYKVNFKLSYKKISVLASILLLFICFGTSLIVSAQIRDVVFGFIKSGIEEIIPSYSQKHNDTGMPILVESKEIEDIADIYYYDLSGVRTEDDVIIKGDLEREYYYLNCGDLVKIDVIRRFEGKITIDGQTFNTKFDILEFQNKKIIKEYTLSNKEDLSLNPIKTFDGRNIWIEKTDRTKLGTQIDYFLYDTETGEIKYVLSEFLTDNFYIESATFFYEKKENILIQAIKETDGKTLYYWFDTENKKIVSLKNLTKINNIATCKFINDKTIFITALPTETSDGENFNGYIYNVADDKLTQIYTSYDNVLFSNGLITIKQKTGYYEIMYHTGERYNLQNVNMEGLTFLSSPSGSKVAVINLENSTKASLKITELGIIDLEAKTFKIFKRKTAEVNEEYSVGWDSRDNLVITTDSMLYQYVFK